MNAISPTYSFIQFSPAAAPAASEFALPVVLDDDIKFQCNIITSDVFQSALITSNDQKLFVVANGAVITDDTSLQLNKLLPNAYVFNTVQTGDNKVLLCWPYGLTNIESLAKGTCFQLCMVVTDGIATEYFISNCFYKEIELKYSSTFEYGSEQSNYGFDYCYGCETNKIRLLMYLGIPQIKEDQSVYFKSDGNRKLTKYNASEEYELIVDFLPQEFHRCLVIALAHESRLITSARYTGGITKDGDYTEVWDRPTDLTAPGSAKVFTSNYVANNNCGICDQYEPPVLCATINQLNGNTQMTPVACADVADITGEAINPKTVFGPTTFVSSDSLNNYEIANIQGGQAGAIVTITLDSLVNNNGGVLKVQGSPAALSDTFMIALDGDGLGTLSAEINGLAASGTVILGHFTITAVSAGLIGTPDTYQTSKVF